MKKLFFSIILCTLLNCVFSQKATIELSPTTIAPVIFKSFTAARNGLKVELKWITATEQDNRAFELQRLVDTDEWKTIAFIFSQADEGNSDVDLSYKYRDTNATKGISHYRLLQIDLNEKIKFSDVCSVRGEGQYLK